jgi:polysaccharide export outer membrane protein
MDADVSNLPGYRQRGPTIFRVNFRDPSGFFAARRFLTGDNNIIYMDNADRVEMTKFRTMLTTVTDAASTVASDVAKAKASVLYVQNRCARSERWIWPSGVAGC